MPRRSELKAETRVEAVLALLRKDESAAALARRYQVSEQTLYRRRDTFLEAGKSGLVKREARLTSRLVASSGWSASCRSARR